jgi:integrase
MPLRVVFRRAIRDELVALNPCERIDLPANRSARVEIVSAERAAELVAALKDARDRALWATAFYAGLRRGELMGLRWRDVDIANGAIHVERACDPDARVFVEPKSRAGRRRVPVVGALRDALLDLRAGLDCVDPEELILGDRPGGPFSYEPMIARARAAWKRAELEPVGLHAACHTCASVMIAASVNVKALSEFLGHASITITLDATATCCAARSPRRRRCSTPSSTGLPHGLPHGTENRCKRAIPSGLENRWGASPPVGSNPTPAVS